MTLMGKAPGPHAHTERHSSLAPGPGRPGSGQRERSHAGRALTSWRVPASRHPGSGATFKIVIITLNSSM